MGYGINDLGKALSPLGWNSAKNTYNSMTANPHANDFKGGTSEDRSNWRADIGYDGYSEEEKAFAEQYLGGIDFGSNKYDKEAQLREWNSKLATRRASEDYKSARETYGKLIDPNSDYNKTNFNRIERMNKPDSYQGGLLYNAMGLGSKSSSFLAQMGLNQQMGKARETSYDQFSQSMERQQQSALGYLDLASGRNQSLLKIMSDERSNIAALKQQKDLENEQRKAQFENSIYKTVIGAGAYAINPALGVGMSTMLNGRG